MRLLTYFPRGRFLKKGVSSELSITKETTVLRLVRPNAFHYGASDWIYVDAIVPTDERIAIRADDPRWLPDGSFRTRAPWFYNKATLATFLASGLKEMDVTEVES